MSRPYSSHIKTNVLTIGKEWFPTNDLDKKSTSKSGANINERIKHVLEKQSHKEIHSGAQANLNAPEEKKVEEVEVKDDIDKSVKVDDKVAVVGESLKKESVDKDKDDGDDEFRKAIAAKIKEKTIRANYVLIGGGTAAYAALESIKKKEPTADVIY